MQIDQPASPTFSICIPVYNGAEYLRQCLSSVEAQTYRDFEVIIVDDGSGDDSITLCRGFAFSPDIRVLYAQNQQHLGLVPNWNRCLDLATGTWIKMLFQDDFLDSRCLESIAAVIEPGPPMIVHRRNIMYNAGTPGWLRQVYDQHRARLAQLMTKRQSPLLTGTEVAGFLVQTMPLNYFGEPTNVTFRRDLIYEFGGFDSRYTQLCDLEYWMRVGTNRGIRLLDRELSTFRVHGASESARNRDLAYFQCAFYEPLRLMSELHHVLLFDDIAPKSRPALILRLQQAMKSLYKRIADRGNVQDQLAEFLELRPSGCLHGISEEK